MMTSQIDTMSTALVGILNEFYKDKSNNERFNQWKKLREEKEKEQSPMESS